jgi:hypothetical protein
MNNQDMTIALGQKTIANLRSVIGDLHVALAESAAKNEFYESALQSKESQIADMQKQIDALTPKEETPAEGEQTTQG